MAVIIALSSFGLILVSIGGGLFLRYKLPDSHLSGDSKDVIRLATALIGTMAAVVVALLFSSTRSTYEATNSQVARLTAGVVELDQLLKEYGGPESLELRGALRNDTASTVSAIWRDDAPVTAQLLRPVTQEDTVLYKLRQLEPKTPVQTAIKARALAVSNDIEQTRLISARAASRHLVETLHHRAGAVALLHLRELQHVIQGQSDPGCRAADLRLHRLDRDLPHPRAWPALRRAAAAIEHGAASRPAAALLTTR